MYIFVVVGVFISRSFRTELFLPNSPIVVANLDDLMSGGLTVGLRGGCLTVGLCGGDLTGVLTGYFLPIIIVPPLRFAMALILYG